MGLAMQRAVDKTENMKARADAVSELEAAGTFDDITALGPGEDDIDQQLKELSSSSAVDDELARMKGELGPAQPAQPGAGGANGGELGAGAPAPPAEAQQPPAAPSEAPGSPSEGSAT